MIYFTVLHWLTIAFFILLYILLIYLARREQKPKIFWSMVFASTLVILGSTVFAMFVLDKYTKKAALYGVKTSRLLNSEEMIVKGQIKNTGKFTIGQCKIKLRFVNNALGTGSKLSGSNVFTPRSGLDLGKSDKDKKSNVLEIKEVIAKSLKPNELRNFSLRFDYPPHFSNVMMIDPKLYCH